MKEEVDNWMIELARLLKATTKLVSVLTKAAEEKLKNRA